MAEAIPIQQLRAKWINMLIYGQNRVGKTTLACTFPKPLLLVALEQNETGGAASVTNVDGVTYLRLAAKIERDSRGHDVVVETATARTKKLFGELNARNPFQTVVVDHVTSLQEIILQEIMGWVTMPAQVNVQAVSGDQYRYRAERTKEVLRMFADLKCHTVFIGKEKDHNPPKEERVGKSGKVQPDMRPRFLRGMQQESWIAADLGGATAGWINDVCDYIGRLYFDKEVISTPYTINGETSYQTNETGRFVRCLRTLYHPNYAAGFRSANPDAVPECIEDPTCDKIAAVIRGEKLPEGRK